MKSVLLIGLGRFGKSVAEKLNELHHQVMAVDKVEEKVNDVLPLVTDAQIGDATNETFLRSLGVDNFDVCIPDDQKAHVFDLFFTSGNPTGDSRRGLGIGLALCDSVIKAHRGRISVADHSPQGVQFEFALPLEEVRIHE